MHRLHYIVESCNTRNVYSIDDLTKRTVRSGGDFPTARLHVFGVQRERKKKGRDLRHSRHLVH